jgi:hypothetical protein
MEIIAVCSDTYRNDVIICTQNDYFYILELVVHKDTIRL